MPNSIEGSSSYVRTAYCPTDQFPGVRKMMKAKCFEILSTKHYEGSVKFTYIHRIDYMRVMLEAFTKGET